MLKPSSSVNSALAAAVDTTITMPQEQSVISASRSRLKRSASDSCLPAPVRNTHSNLKSPAQLHAQLAGEALQIVKQRVELEAKKAELYATATWENVKKPLEAMQRATQKVKDASPANMFVAAKEYFAVDRYYSWRMRRACQAEQTVRALHEKVRDMHQAQMIGTAATIEKSPSLSIAYAAQAANAALVQAASEAGIPPPAATFNNLPELPPALAALPAATQQAPLQQRQPQRVLTDYLPAAEAWLRSHPDI